MDINAKQKKILLAVRPADCKSVLKLMGAEFDSIICSTLEEAVERLNDDIGVILCGVRFDFGQMFELLDAVRANPETEMIPYYLIVTENARYSSAILEGIRRAAKVKGISGFINLSMLVSELGEKEAHDWIRQGMRSILDMHSNIQTANAAYPSFPDSMIGRRYMV